MKKQPPTTTPIKKRHDPKPSIEIEKFDRETEIPARPIKRIKESEKTIQVRFPITDFIKTKESK